MTLPEKYLELLAKKKELEKEMQAVADEHAIKICPYKVGEESEIFSYSHKGKRWKVSRIWGIASDYDGKIEWKVEGHLIKKDGSVGNMKYELSQWQYQNAIS